MAEVRAFFVNPSKIPDEPMLTFFAHCVSVPIFYSSDFHEFHRYGDLFAKIFKNVNKQLSFLRLFVYILEKMTAVSLHF